jgi:hypothetical protein
MALPGKTGLELLRVHRRSGGRCPSKVVRMSLLNEIVTSRLLDELGPVPMREKVLILAEDPARQLAQVTSQSPTWKKHDFYTVAKHTA